MNKEEITAEIKDVNAKLDKVILLIKEVQDNSNKILSDDMAEENSLLSLMNIKSLEKAEFIINSVTDSYVGLQEFVHYKITEKDNETIKTMINKIINQK